MAKDIWNSKNFKEWEPKKQKRFRGRKIMEKNHSRTCIRCLTRSLGAKNAIDVDFGYELGPSEGVNLDPQALRNKNEDDNDLFLCDKCWNEEFQASLKDKMFFCDYCGLYYEAFEDIAHPERTTLMKHVCFAGIAHYWTGKSKEDSMLYIHYEDMPIAQDIVDVSGGSLEPVMIKFKFSSSSINCVLNFKRDGEMMNQLIFLIKQIPASHRSFDPVDYIWTIGESKFEPLKMLVNAQDKTRPFCCYHSDLNAFIYPPKVEKKDQSWAEEIKARHNFKTEQPEDFFHSVSAESLVLNQSTIETKMLQLIKPYINFEPALGNKMDFGRAYKLAARRLHPDLATGDASKMSELNMLWMQYKEVAK